MCVSVRVGYVYACMRMRLGVSKVRVRFVCVGECVVCMHVGTYGVFFFCHLVKSTLVFAVMLVPLARFSLPFRRSAHRRSDGLITMAACETSRQNQPHAPSKKCVARLCGRSAATLENANPSLTVACNVWWIKLMRFGPEGSQTRLQFKASC